MSRDLLEQVDALQWSLLHLENIDDQLCSELLSRLRSVADQVPIVMQLASTSRLVKKGAELPVRRINYNIKKLSDDCKPRWDELLKLNCETLIFFTLAFNGLVSLPDDEFNWLIQNLQYYVNRQGFLLSKTPRKDSTKPFLAS
ncbi:hypothetical protein BDV26DRAFT_299327 [Aspergillus bertholletiae]|uniref:Uncharacterized protein n=1 Tax=Aspergillus bertholletiae TaxID=1226010 RepID=A0A5N7BPX1_9EURO|nr:hypothetical protein BDV26DRAFT_299327 [Aspergillus bertholletiae]